MDDILQAGALGAKIVESGRDGSIVVLAAANDQEKAINAIKKARAKDVYPVNVDIKATIINT